MFNTHVMQNKSDVVVSVEQQTSGSELASFFFLVVKYKKMALKPWTARVSLYIPLCLK